MAKVVKNRQAATLTEAWQHLNKKIETAGVRPYTYIMDNECMQDLKNALNKENIKYQLVPPHLHQANKAERAIQTMVYYN